MLLCTIVIRSADMMVAHTVYLIMGNKVNEPGLANVAMPEPEDER